MSYFGLKVTYKNCTYIAYTTYSYIYMHETLYMHGRYSPHNTDFTKM